MTEEELKKPFSWDSKEKTTPVRNPWHLPEKITVEDLNKIFTQKEWEIENKRKQNHDK